MLYFNQFEAKFGNFQNCMHKKHDVVRFIHASDIHLGSHQYRNDYRADDFIHVFQEILELAITHHVDFIILGGDVFTSLEMLPGKLEKIVNLLRDFYQYTNETILIITIEGNHDIRKFSRGVRFKQRGQSWLKLLGSLGLIILLDADLEALPMEMFKPFNFKTRKGGKIHIKNVMIYGTRYLGEKPISYLSKIRKGIQNHDGLFHILIQHFGIEGQMKNVPGINIDYIQPLKHRIDYLALGHFHKQFIIDGWIYNPGSPEAVCPMDSSFKRGVFLVEIIGEQKYIKKVQMIRLNNRNFLWETIMCKNYRNNYDFYKYIIQKLKQSLNTLNPNIEPSNSMMPVLYLILKGLKPSKLCNIKERELSKLIINEIPVVDVRIYQKFTNSSKSLDKFL
ncbi:MAG: exonuclease SbcCD subunit D [Candidatus Hodarchaeota archaeon]